MRSLSVALYNPKLLFVKTLNSNQSLSVELGINCFVPSEKTLLINNVKIKDKRKYFLTFEKVKK
jgi:hypothetical protein